MATTRTTRRPSAGLVGRACNRLARASSCRWGPARARGRRRTLLVLVIGLGTGIPMANAQTARIVPSIAVESTLTDNVNLSANRTPDWVNQLTPSVTFSEVSAHTHLSGGISLPILLYARTSENNGVFPEANVA